MLTLHVKALIPGISRRDEDNQMLHTLPHNSSSGQAAIDACMRVQHYQRKHALDSRPVQSMHEPVPLQLGDLTLRNRNIVGSTLRNRSVPTNVPNDLNLERYVQRARGGAGLIMTEATLVSQQGTEWPYNPGIWNEEQIAVWKTVSICVLAGPNVGTDRSWF